MAEKGRGRPKCRRFSGKSKSPLIVIDGPDRLVPFELDGVPQIPRHVQAAIVTNRVTRAKAQSIGATVRKATAELRRRYEQHNEQALAALVAREAEEDFDDEF